MALVEKNVKVSKEADELASVIAKIVGKFVEAKADDGKVSMDEVIAAVVSLLSDLPKALEGIELIDDELKEDPFAFAFAWAIAGKEVFKKLKK